MIICAMRESCFLDSVLLMYLSISLPWVEKSLMKKVSSHLHMTQVLFLFEIFPAGLVQGPRNPKFLSEKASFYIFFSIQTLLHCLSCSHLGFLKSLINPRYLCNFADLAISAVYVCINCTHRARKNGFTNQKSEYIILLISFKCFGQNENCPSNV